MLGLIGNKAGFSGGHDGLELNPFFSVGPDIFMDLKMKPDIQMIPKYPIRKLGRVHSPVNRGKENAISGKIRAM